VSKIITLDVISNDECFQLLESCPGCGKKYYLLTTENPAANIYVLCSDCGSYVQMYQKDTDVK